MDWFASLIKMAGVSFPMSAPFVQMLSDRELAELEARIRKLEDPVSHLHTDVPELSKLLYTKLKDTNSVRFALTDELYAKYHRALAVLESEDLIEGGHTLSKRYSHGITLADPTFVMYLCLLFEDFGKMEALYQTLDACPIGESLNGEELQQSLGLPIPVIHAGFQIFESKGYGLVSKTLGSSEYISRT